MLTNIQITNATVRLLLIGLVLYLNLQSVLSIKKGWGYKSIKKLSKSEVEMKAYVFPCSMDEEKFLNSTFGKKHKHLQNCVKKLVIKLTINSGGEYCSKSDGFIPVDHVIDGITGRKKRLLNPLMIRLKREKMYQLYDMQLIKSVNAEAREEVINYENASNFTGCDTSSSHPTCGFSFFNNKIIQFSEGFCCSCDQVKNDQRQPCEGHSGEGKNIPDITQYAVRHHRSNRTSRDLETMEIKPGLVLEATGVEENMEKRVPVASLMKDQKVEEEQVVEDGNIINLLGFRDLENNDKSFVSDNSFDEECDTNSPAKSVGCMDNVTIRSFQFEHTLIPQNFDKNRPHTLTNINILIESQEKALDKEKICESGEKKNEDKNSESCEKTENEQNKSKGVEKVLTKGKNVNNEERFGDNEKNCKGEDEDKTSKSNNSLSNERLRMLFMNKIKQNKLKEKVTTTDCPLSSDLAKQPPNVRSLKDIFYNHDHGKEVIDANQKTFSLKLASGDSELEINIATKKPKDTESNNTKIIKHYSNACISNKFIGLHDIPKNSKSFKNDAKSYKSEFSTDSKYLPSKNTLQPKIKISNVESIEKIVNKVVPLINSAHSSLEHKTYEKADIVLKDTENTTHKMFIELNNKPVSPKFSARGYPKIQNSAVSFSLKNDILNNSIPIHDLKLLQVQGPVEGEFPSYAEVQKSKAKMPLMVESHLNIEKREANSCDKQIRGGQSCLQDGKDLPCNADPDAYFESAHCLRFSDLWYNIHRLLNPRMENSITFKIYAKHNTVDKKICWENLTKRIGGRVGTTNDLLADDARNIVILYSSSDKVAYSLDCASDYLLVPQPIPRRCKDKELKELSCGGVGEYLLVKEGEITFDGEECDRVGVTHSAFARQSHRCQRPAQSCLHNQPLHFWREDKKAAAEGKQGQYFLKNFITVTEQAILQNTSSNQVVLRAPYFERYQSHIVVELNADHIDIIADRSEGQVTEVYIDATSDKVTIVKTVITNLGIAPDYFGVDFANCSSPLGPSDFDKPSKDEVPPQHRITYTATISVPLSHKQIDCKLVLYNADGELIAWRHITIVRGERCMCVWHCRCVCVDSPRPGLPCSPLSLREYNRAGFPGHLPVTSATADCSVLFTVLQALIWFFLFLILFGLIKAILGLCFSRVGVWGLWYLLPDEAQSLYCYMEPELACYPIMHDHDGFPIHPRTFARSVRFLPWYSEFPVNVFFFMCVARTCLCDKISRRASMAVFPHQQYRPMNCSQSPTRRRCSPGCSTRRHSPCDSTCLNRGKFRLAAGGETQLRESDPQALADEQLAKRLVDELTRSYVVFRNLSRPMGGVHSVPGAPYCIRGFFLQSDNGVYEFSPPSPLMQVWQMDHTPLEPPVLLDPTPFRAVYRGAAQVLAARELSTAARGVVINAP